MKNMFTRETYVICENIYFPFDSFDLGIDSHNTRSKNIFKSSKLHKIL